MTDKVNVVIRARLFQRTVEDVTREFIASLSIDGTPHVFTMNDGSGIILEVLNTQVFG